MKNKYLYGFLQLLLPCLLIFSTVGACADEAALPLTANHGDWVLTLQVGSNRSLKEARAERKRLQKVGFEVVTLARYDQNGQVWFSTHWVANQPEELELKRKELPLPFQKQAIIVKVKKTEFQMFKQRVEVWPQEAKAVKVARQVESATKIPAPMVRQQEMEKGIETKEEPSPPKDQHPLGDVKAPAPVVTPEVKEEPSPVKDQHYLGDVKAPAPVVTPEVKEEPVEKPAPVALSTTEAPGKPDEEVGKEEKESEGLISEQFLKKVYNGLGTALSIGFTALFIFGG